MIMRVSFIVLLCSIIFILASYLDARLKFAGSILCDITHGLLSE